MSASSLPSLAGRKEPIDGSGRIYRIASALVLASEARAAIVAKLRELDRAVTVAKLYAELEGPWSLAAVEYHLTVLVKAGVVEMVLGPEIQFGLVGRGGGTEDLPRERCR